MGRRDWPGTSEALDEAVISGQALGLLAVAVGAAIALTLQQVVRHFRRSDVCAQRVKDECVRILIASRDLRDRVAAGQPDGWDARAYRLARARLRNLDPALPIQAALADLDEARLDLTLAWRLPAPGRQELAEAAQAHQEAIERFATCSSVLVRLALLQVAVPGVKLVRGLSASLPEYVEDGVEQDERQLLEESSCILAGHVA
jgi:hypothetical protein